MCVDYLHNDLFLSEKRVERRREAGIGRGEIEIGKPGFRRSSSWNHCLSLLRHGRAPKKPIKISSSSGETRGSHIYINTIHIYHLE